MEGEGRFVANKRVRDDRNRRFNRAMAAQSNAPAPTGSYKERTSWKRPLGIAIASTGLIAGSLWLLTQDLDRLDTITTIGDAETAADVEPTPTTVSTPRPTATPRPRTTPAPAEALDLDRFTLTADATATPKPLLRLDLPEGAVAIPTRIPALPQLEPRPRVPTIPTLVPSTPVALAPAAPAPALPPAAAPAPPRTSPFTAAPAPAPQRQPQPVPVPPPPPVVIAPAPAPAATAGTNGCAALVVPYDLNRDGVADGSLPSPCGPCPSGAAPGLQPGDSMLDC